MSNKTKQTETNLMYNNEMSHENYFSLGFISDFFDKMKSNWRPKCNSKYLMSDASEKDYIVIVVVQY